MVLVLTRFALRSYLASPEGVRLFFQTVDRDVAITMSARDGANITSFEGIDLSWITRYDQSQTFTISENDVDRDVDIAYFKMGLSLDDFRGGQIVPSRFSVINVFSELAHADPEAGFHLGRHVEWAESILQDVIDIYRWATNDPYVSLHDTLATQIVLVGIATKYTFDAHGTHGEFSFKTHHVKVEHPVLHGRRKLPMEENAKNIIADYLRTRKSLHPHERILLQAREQATINRNYEMSIVTNGTAFEVFLQNRLMASCEYTGTKVLPATNKKLTSHRSAIDTGNIQRDLLRYVDLLAPSVAPVKASQQYRRWKNQAYDVRNEIVHRGRRGITQTQAKDAFTAVQDFITYLNANLP